MIVEAAADRSTTNSLDVDESFGKPKPTANSIFLLRIAKKTRNVFGINFFFGISKIHRARINFGISRFQNNSEEINLEDGLPEGNAK